MSDRKLKVLMMIDQFYPIVGGAESQAKRISERLIQRGHQVSVLTRKGKKELDDFETVDGIDIYRLPILGLSGKQKLKAILPARKWLTENRDKFDIIHCHGVNPLEWSAYLSQGATKKPYVVKIPLSNFLNYAGAKKGVKMTSKDSGRLLRSIIRPMMLPALKFIRKRLIGHAACVFAISPEIETTLLEHGYTNVINIPNGIESDKFSPATSDDKITLRSKLGFERDEVIFIYSGRLSMEKNLFVLLNGWNDFIKSANNIKAKLVLLGGGKGQSYSIEEELRSLVEQKNIPGVIFQGAVSNVVEYLKAGDVFVLPSLWEGMSNSLLEAMACGLPSVVSDIPGNRALITQNETGLFFETDDFKSLSGALKIIYTQNESRVKFGANARKLINDEFDLDMLTEKIIEQYYKSINGVR